MRRASAPTRGAARAFQKDRQAADQQEHAADKRRQRPGLPGGGAQDTGLKGDTDIALEPPTRMAPSPGVVASLPERLARGENSRLDALRRGFLQGCGRRGPAQCHVIVRVPHPSITSAGPCLPSREHSSVLLGSDGPNIADLESALG